MARWRNVKGYDGLYIVSDEGDVMSLPRIIDNGKAVYLQDGRVLKPGFRGNEGLKYKYVLLCKNGEEKSFSVHRLVAEAFLDNPDGLPEVNHKDENPLNNCVDNLEWCDRQYNIEYSKNKRVAQYTVDGEKIAEYKSITYAAQMTGVHRNSITNVLRGWSNTAGGYGWKYVD